MIGADAHGRAILLTYLHQGCELLADSLKLGFVGMVGILNNLKPLFVSVITGIDAHLFYNACGQLGCVGVK